MTDERIDVVADGAGALKLDVPPFECPACGHNSPYGNPKGHVLRCSECGSRIAYGRAMPRVVVEPCEDRRFVSMRLEAWDRHVRGWAVEHTMVVDKDYARAIWHNVESISR